MRPVTSQLELRNLFEFKLLKVDLLEFGSVKSLAQRNEVCLIVNLENGSEVFQGQAYYYKKVI
jgi:hypothetical protein